MDYLTFKQETCEMMVKISKKSVTAMRSCTYLNISIGALNAYLAYHQEPVSFFTAFCTGAVVGNVLWCLASLHSFKDDLKLEKQHLERIKELQSSQEYQDAVRDLKRTKEYYADHQRYMNVSPSIFNASHENTQPESASQAEGKL